MADTFGFSLSDAKRIGKAVRVVERDGARQDLTGEKDATVSRGVRLMLAKHESASGWATGTTAIVTVYGGDPIASAITVVAHNQFLTFSTCSERWVALGHNGWGWYAINQQKASTSTCSMDYAGVDFSGIQGYASNKKQALTHDENACLKWMDIESCE